MSVLMPTLSDSNAELHQELTAVHARLTNAIHDLTAPLNELVLAQLKRTFSPLRAGLLIAAGTNETETAALREKRILLAAALEMLYLALSVHKLLLINAPPAEDAEADKTRIGSLVLAGDYCFSYAAMFAAYTDQPAVVDAFARALKAASEGNLRLLFQPTALAFQDQQELIEAGLLAASRLANLTEVEQQRVMVLGRQLATRLYENAELDVATLTAQIQQAPSSQQRHWSSLLSL